MWLIALLLVGGLTFDEAEPWLGRYAAGPEVIAFRWEEDGLVYVHGNIIIPVDGEWRETVPEFIVRHRATWLAEENAVLLEETHDRSAPWRYELRLDPETGRLRKWTDQGGEMVVVRTYEPKEP